MALLIRMDINNSHRAASIVIVRGEPHTKLRNHFWYSYKAKEDTAMEYHGKVLHNYYHGAFTLTQKVTKAIVAQQRAAKVQE